MTTQTPSAYALIRRDTDHYGWIVSLHETAAEAVEARDHADRDEPTNQSRLTKSCVDLCAAAIEPGHACGTRVRYARISGD